MDRIGAGRGQQSRHLDLVLTPFSFQFYNHLQTVKWSPEPPPFLCLTETPLCSGINSRVAWLQRKIFQPWCWNNLLGRCRFPLHHWSFFPVKQLQNEENIWKKPTMLHIVYHIDADWITGSIRTWKGMWNGAAHNLSILHTAAPWT